MEAAFCLQSYEAVIHPLLCVCAQLQIVWAYAATGMAVSIHIYVFEGMNSDYYDRPESHFGYAEHQQYYQDPYGRPISRGGGY